jgi:3-isopropylmalate dehydratase small subunit
MKQDKKPVSSFADIFKRNKEANKLLLIPTEKVAKKVCWLLKSPISYKKESTDV